MKKLIFALLLICGVPALAQQVTGNLTASTTDCTVAAACLMQNLGSTAGAASITLSGTWSATVQFEATGNNDANYQAISCVPTNSTVTATSSTTTGTWTCNVAGLTNIRVRVSSYSSGTVAVTMNKSPAAASSRFAPGAPVGSFNILPSVVSIGSQGSAGAGSTLTLSPPASIVNGNILIATVSADGINPTWTPPAGFSAMSFSPISSAANHITNAAFFCKVASSESGNYVFTISSPSGGESLLVGQVIQYSGAGCTLDGSGTATGNANNLTVNGFATTNANDLVVMFARQNGTGAGVANLAKPITAQKQLQVNNEFIYTIANGSGNTQNAKVAFAQSGGAPNTTDDSVMAVFALAPSGISSAAPLIANGATFAATLDSIHLTNGVQADGNISGNQLIMPVGGSCSSNTVSGIYFQVTAGIPFLALCTNGSNLMLDPVANLNQVTIGSGTRSSLALLVQKDIDPISNDSSQDLFFMDSSANSSNTLTIGCPINPCTGGTQQGDIQVNAQTGKLIHAMTALVDRLTIGDTKNLLTAGSGNPTTILSIPVATGQSGEGQIHFGIHGDDGTPAHVASISGQVSYACENTGAVFKCGVDTAAGDLVLKELTGADTLTISFALSGANPAVLTITPTASAVYTTWTITYTIEHYGQTVPTF